jgi:hypothetical protein
MAAADLSGVDAKIGWAKCHLAALKEAIDDTLDAHPCQLVGQMDRETAAYVFTVHNLPAMDPTWGLRVGDVVHNLRCALDHLAWQLVILENKKPNRNTQFPIRRYPRVNEKAEQLQVKFEPAFSNSAILDALESIQPYADPRKAGEHPLLAVESSGHHRQAPRSARRSSSAERGRYVLGMVGREPTAGRDRQRLPARRGRLGRPV